MAAYNDSRPTFVYRCYDASGALLYVGCSVQPRVRVENHRLSSWWGDQIATVRTIVFPNRIKALAMEREAIFCERPRHNVKGRWYRADPRADWTQDDYRHLRTAIRRTSLIGSLTQQLLSAVEQEAFDRFGSDWCVA